MQPHTWLRRPQHLIGLLTAATILAAPLARAMADDPHGAAPPDLDKRVHQLEGRIHELESQMQGAGTKSSGLIPGVLIGPRLNLIALPTPTLGAEAKILRYLGVSFDYGFIPKFKVDEGLTVQYSSWNLTARVFPWGKTFFLGAMLGHYGFSSSASGTNGTGSVDVSSSFFGPVIGGRWIQNSGFFTGLDLGWGFPLKYSSVTSEGASGTPLDIKDKADQYLRHGMPLLAVVSFGYFF